MKRFLLSILALVTMATGSQAQNTINGHEYVDLGLPSGILWATMNVGANSPTEVGGNFAWGETVPKINFMEENYDQFLYQKYNDSSTNPFLEISDDAAYANWGDSWRMPDMDDFTELVENCTKTEDMEGITFTSKKNYKSIFLPYYGYMNDYGALVPLFMYWTRTNLGPKVAASVDDRFITVVCNKYEGTCVRPIYDPRTHEHVFSTYWNFNEFSHYKACFSTIGTCDGTTKDEAAHTFNAYDICTVCGYGGFMEYGFSVYSTKVTSKNMNDILGDGAFIYSPRIKSLKVKGNHLSNLGTFLQNESASGLSVDISGNFTLEAMHGIISHKTTWVAGPGKLTLKTGGVTTDIFNGSTLIFEDLTVDAESDNWGIAGENSGEKLFILNSTIKAKASRGAMCDFDGGITLTGCKIVKPVGGYVKDGDVVDASGNLAIEVIIARNGDANLDGAVDIADVVSVLNAMASDSNAPQFNVNGDSAVDIADVVAILNIMAQQ